MAKKDAVNVPDVSLEDDRRVPVDEQPIALSIAEEAGILPDEDRRHDEPELVMESSAPDPIDAASALHEDPVFKALSGTPAPDVPRLPDTGDLIPKLNSPLIVPPPQ